MENRIYLYPKWIRIWHTFNAILILTLIVTGLSMQYTDKDNYYFVMSFDRAVKWHNYAALLLTGGFAAFVMGNLLTKNGRYYRLKKQNLWSELWKQLRYYSWGMFKSEKHPFPVTEDRKFNPLQKVSYVLAMYLAMPLLIISGVGLFFPEITINRFFGISGLILTDILHVTMGFLLSVFLIIHIYTCTLGNKPSSLFKSMITGYHEPENH
jgi:thiosulfate reductase cytochrome b subunit